MVKFLFNPFSGTLDEVSEEDLTGYVPYTGATGNVDLGAHNYLGTDVNITGDIYLDDSKKFYLGDGNDASIYYDGTDLKVETSSGDIYLYSDDDFFIHSTNGDVKLWPENGEIQLLAKAVTNSDFRINDDKKILLGSGEDASIYYDGTDLIINPREVGSGDVIITDGGSETNIEINNTAGDGDPQLRFALTGTTKYSIGIDDSDNDVLKISGGSGVSTSTHLFEFDKNVGTVGTVKAQFVYNTGGNFNAGDNTPTVRFYNRFRFPSTGRAYTVSTFDDGTDGQIIYLNFGSVQVTVVDQSQVGGNNIYLSGGNNFISTQNSTLTLIRESNKWLELSRMQY